MTSQRPPRPLPQWLVTSSSWAWRLMLLVAFGYVCILVLLRLRLVVVPVVLAAALAALLYRQVNLFDRFLPRTLAALIVSVGWSLLTIALVVSVAARISASRGELIEGVEGGLITLQSYLSRLGFAPDRLAQLQADATRALSENQEVLTSGILSGATLLVEALVAAALLVVVLFFFLRDGPSIWSWFTSFFPSQGERIDVAGRAALGTLAGYLRGTATIALVDALAMGVALWVLGVPLVVPLVMLVFLGAFVPVVGAFVAGSVAVLVALVTVGPLTALLVLAAIVLVQQVEGNVLAPVVFGRALSLHPLVVLLALAGGGILGGIFGAATAVPFVAACWAVIRALSPAATDPVLVTEEGAPPLEEI